MKYTAFISYNSKDDKWAKWLQRKLEAYQMPVVIRNERDEMVRKEDKPKKMRVFRYRADLNTISLNEGLAKELDDARWLIVICSPNSAKSVWVGKEIQHFLDTGRRNKILPFIVNGTSYANNEHECLNPVLKAAFPKEDILGVNIHDYGDDPWIYRKRKALVRTVSILIEVPDAYSYLWNRYRLRYWEGIAMKAVGTMAVLALLLYAWQYHASFDTEVRLHDTTPKNSLPMPDSLNILLQLENEEKTLSLSRIQDIGSYKNLPGKYAGKEVHLLFSAEGYEPVDTVVELERGHKIELNIHRNDKYGVLSGIVMDENGHPISDALIEAEGETSTSTPDGHFEIFIPIERQKPKPYVRISKAGYLTEEYTESPVGTDWIVMLRINQN